MARQKLIAERILYTKSVSLTDEDISSLKAHIIRQVRILGPALLCLTLIGIYIWIEAPVNRKYDEAIEKDHANFLLVMPYTVTFFWLMLAIYFTVLYFREIAPLRKDIKCGQKNLLFFQPKKSAMPMFNKYYLSTPLFKQQQVEVSHEDFDKIADHELYIEVGPNSNYILRLKKDDEQINYW